MRREPRTRRLLARKSAIHHTKSHKWSQHQQPQMAPREVGDYHQTRGRTRGGDRTGPQKRERTCWRTQLSNGAEDLCCHEIWSSKFSRALICMIDVILDCSRGIMFQCQCRIFDINFFFMYSRSTEWKHWFRTAVFQIFSHLCQILFLYSLSSQHLEVFERAKIYHVHII